MFPQKKACGSQPFRRIPSVSLNAENRRGHCEFHSLASESPHPIRQISRKPNGSEITIEACMVLGFFRHEGTFDPLMISRIVEKRRRISLLRIIGEYPMQRCLIPPIAPQHAHVAGINGERPWFGMNRHPLFLVPYLQRMTVFVLK